MQLRYIARINILKNDVEEVQKQLWLKKKRSGLSGVQAAMTRMATPSSSGCQDLIKTHNYAAPFISQGQSGDDRERLSCSEPEFNFR